MRGGWAWALAVAVMSAAWARSGWTDTVKAQGLAFDLPDGWVQQAPSSGMRLAQAAIPGEAGAGELAVFHFGPGGGGGVEANLERWLGQVEPAPGTKPSRAQFDVGGLQVTWVETAGTLKAGMMGMGPAKAQPGSRLFGAVIEGPGGPWFIKATGPDATLSAAQDDFIALLHTVRAP
ncbi:MAG TPA: hypothetical protein VGB20_05420 [bacterium]